VAAGAAVAAGAGAVGTRIKTAGDGGGTGTVTFLITLLITIVAAFALRNIIKRLPMLFYAIAALFLLLFLARSLLPLPLAVERTMLMLLGKCILAQALLVVVMFIGALPEKSRAREWLAPVRAELSIIACILAAAHIVEYLSTIGMRIITSFTLYEPNVLLSFCLSLFLTLLLALLAVTSFRMVKVRINNKHWRKIQWLAYPFFLLTWLHILLYLLPSALQGGQAAQVSVIAYSVVYLAYLVARSLVAVTSRKRAITKQR
jgi:DMSO/TMAO reductase YedYZ heme-binding membrane subunit